VPFASSCCGIPTGTDGFGGVIAIEVNVAEVTFCFAEPWTPEKAQVTEVLPTPIPVMSPGDVPLTCTIPVSLEVQLDWLVQSWVVPSLKLQVVVSCAEVPLAIEAFGTVMLIEVRAAAVTVTVVAPLVPFKVAAIGVFPEASPVTSPMVAATLLTWAIPAFTELQIT